MTIHFKDKVAVVTGAGTGLGRSHALHLAAHGAKVLVNDLGGTWDGVGESQAPAVKVVEEIRAGGGQAEANFKSVADPEGAQSIIESAIEHFGTVDILICNAGILRDKIFIKMTLEDFNLVLQVHLLGTVYTTKAAFPIMKEKKYGRIVFTTSAAGLFGNFGQTNYAAAKMGIIGFMNALKLEGHKHNILVNTVAPLAMTRLAEPSAIFPENVQPLLRPELVTAMVAYLCSEQCHTTGDILSAGGGFYSKAQLFEGEGIRFDPNENVTPEMIADNFSRITDMENSKAYFSVAEEAEKSLGPLFSD